MADIPENTGGEREYEVGYKKPPVHTRFGPGNPGRPKGSRNKLSEDFFRELAKAFEDRGAAALAAMIEESPKDFIKTIASLQSKELTGEDGEDIPVALSIALKGVRADGS
jgi:hypothetical protein